MEKEQHRILKMVSKGKLSVDEAEKLLEALNGSPVSDQQAATVPEKPVPRFLLVKVISNTEDNVNVKIPLSLIRAGMRLTSLIPPQAMDQINDSMSQHGMSIDLNNLKQEDIDTLLTSLSDMEINVDSKNGDTVRVYCE